MRLGTIELFCADVHDTRDFYLNVLGFASVEEDDTIQLSLGTICLTLKQGRQKQPGPYECTRTALVLLASNRPALLISLKEMEIPHQFDDADPPGILVQDPDRRWIHIVEPC